MKRICSKCKQEKELTDFSPAKGFKYGRSSWCRNCCNARARERRAENPTKRRAYELRYRQSHREKCREVIYRCRKTNPEKYRNQIARWQKENKERAREISRRTVKKIRSTPKGKLAYNMRRAIWSALKGNKNGRNWEKLVGYSVEDLQKHLEKRFTIGMTWQNQGKWHIDHCIPISAFNFEKPEDIDFQKCWALENLQPLWGSENARKGKNLSQPFQPSFRYGKEAPRA